MDTDVERRCACTKGKIYFVDKVDDKGSEQSERRKKKNSTGRGMNESSKRKVKRETREQDLQQFHVGWSKKGATSN